MDNESKLLQAHLPCDDCGSSDALSLYSNGTSYCFSCKASKRVEVEDEEEEVSVGSQGLKLVFKAIPARSLSRETCVRFSYGMGADAGGSYQAAAYQDGAIKLRYKDKRFVWSGKHKGDLFGQQLWKSGGHRIVITEGEIDALSVYEACGETVAVVSLANGASSAEKAVLQNLEWLSQFDEILICFDNDKPGKEAAEAVFTLFKPGKVFRVNLPHKDANETLVKDGAQALKLAIRNAEAWRPDGVLRIADLWDRIKEKPKDGLSYPWKQLTDLTRGIRKREMVVLGAGVGIGKTTQLKQIGLHLMKIHKKKVGFIFLEEDTRDTVLSLMTKDSGKVMHLEDEGVTDEERRKAFDDLSKDNLLCIYDGCGAIDYNTIASRIRYMVLAEGCEYIFLDHVTALTDGCDEKQINQRMRNIVSDLSSMVRELDFHLTCITHLRKPSGTPHEEGGRVTMDHFYGSASLKQWANFCFGIERNQQAEDRAERNRSLLRCLKDRLRGQGVGTVIPFEYDHKTTLLKEITNVPSWADNDQGTERNFSDEDNDF